MAKIHELNRDAVAEAGATGPSLSVVVPVYDDPEGCDRTVESLLSVDYDRYEVIVVVTPTDGETLAAAQAHERERERITVCTESEHETPGSARNVGVEAATGDVVAFLDADMTVPTAFPRQVASVFATTDVDYLGYAVSVGSDASESTAAGRYDRRMRFPNEVYVELFDYCPTCALAVRSDVFADGLRFVPWLISGEDVVFGRDVADAGYEQAYCPDVEVHHPARTSLRAITRKGLKTGRGFFQIHANFSRQILFTGSRLRSLDAYRPPPTEYLAAVCDGWADLGRYDRFEVRTVAYLETLAQTAGYVAQSLREPDRSPPDA